MLKILSMFGPFAAAKFWVAAIMGLVQFIQIYFGIDVGLDQEIVTGLIAGITALFVWLVPNKKNQFPDRPGLY